MSTISNTSTTRAAVQLAPTATSRLPLWLALLAVPGVTVAWELPGGGFYTGVPAAIAAIVLSARARREHGASAMTTVATVVASLCLLLVAGCIAFE